MAQRRNWNMAEVRAALALYLRTNFGRFHKTNPDVITLARQLGRTPSAVALKLGNLAARPIARSGQNFWPIRTL